MSCRARAQSVHGVTEAQQAGLSRGRVKGENRRTGYKHRDESKRKTSEKNRIYWAANRDKALVRAVGRRGASAYNWKGGVTRLNTSIRLMHEYRVWTKRVRERDGCCVRCGATKKLHAHHKRPFAKMLQDCGIKSRETARQCAFIIFDINIGETLCVACHDAEHGRNRRVHVPTHAAALTGFACQAA